LAPRYVPALLLAAVLLGGTGAQAAGATGPFTLEQVVAGRTAFLDNCTGCHGAFMSGGGDAPALTGANFQEDWLNKSTKQLFQFASTNMPFNNAGMLSRQTYADLVAFILAVNGATPGPVPFTGDAEVKIGSIADGDTVLAVLDGEGPYAPPPPQRKVPAKKRR
jgi:alcohol dehydrogenase (cytochrome c)